MDMSSAGAIAFSMVIGATAGAAGAKLSNRDHTVAEAMAVTAPVGLVIGAAIQGAGEAALLRPGTFELNFWGNRTGPIIRHATVGALMGAVAGAAVARVITLDRPRGG